MALPYVTEDQLKRALAQIQTSSGGEGSTAVDAYTKTETDALLADKADTSAITTLTGEVTTLSSSVAALTSTVSTLSSSVSTLSGEVSTLSSSLGDKADASAVTSLSSTVTTLSSNVSSLSSTVSTLSSAVSTLSTAVDALVEVPAIPADAADKTYVLKIVSGTLTWVEETASD